MGVTIGTQLGSLEILSLLGRGGMGEVYRARDTKLKREVAIKILPDEFSHDSDRVARFQREAEVLASLNHPNIAAIYDLEEANGSRFLVLELVEGETLAERVKHGPIPIDEALNIAKSICEALEAAHEKGVVHRDLKPANVKITPDGKVKVLDFGLAKAFAGEAANANFSNSPTLSIAATNAGVILGTAAYMSPEQAKGMTLDRRTDIFSFGAVLYEMLTARQAFQGDTVADIMARVLEREPDWNRLSKDTPSAIRRLIERCLRKDRNRRVQTAAEARIEIEDALAKPERSGQAAPPIASRRRERLAWIAVVALAAVAAGSVALYFRGTGDAPETRVDIITPSTSDPSSFDLSPDGRRLVFVVSEAGLPRLWLRPLDATTAQPLAGTEGATLPFWSPDSKSVAFFAGGALKRIDIGGGLPQRLADAPAGRGGAWSSQDTILFAPTAASPLFRIPASGGQPVAATKLASQQTSHWRPHFLPDGRQFMFYAPASAEGPGIYLGSLDSTGTKRVTAANSIGLILPSGWLLYAREDTLVAQRFDPRRGEVTGSPVTVVADQVRLFRLGAGNPSIAAFSVSATGTIAYRIDRATDRRQLTWFNRTGKMIETLGGPDENNLLNPRLSPDGRRVAVDRTVQGNTDVYIMDETRSTRFTFDAKVDHWPIWSPDGPQIAFVSTRKGVGDLYVKSSSGTGNEELLIESAVSKIPSDYSPDGRFLLIYSNNSNLQLLPMEGGPKPQPVLHTEFSGAGSRFSPDGRWVSYHSGESGREEIYMRSFPGPGGVRQVSSGGGVSSRWSPNGKELYYIAPDEKLMAVPIERQGNTLIPGTPTALFQTRIALGGLNNTRAQYDVSPDGRFLINQTLDNYTTTPITLLMNWKPPAK